jgi:hypothetical protein
MCGRPRYSGPVPKPRIMYIENKTAGPPGLQGFMGPARIGRVTFSKSGKSIYYNGRTLFSVGKSGYKYNYVDEENRDEYWVSGPRRDGEDGLYGYRATPIDEDVREEYWTTIRRQPEKKNRRTS